MALGQCIMNIVREEDVPVEEAVRMLTDFTNDETLQELGTASVKSVNRIAANLAVAAHEIYMPDFKPKDAAESPRKRRHRRHHHHEEAA